ncbi:hypothetical protein ACNKHK_11870 [Shigella flexneri]
MAKKWPLRALGLLDQAGQMRDMIQNHLLQVLMHDRDVSTVRSER